MLKSWVEARTRNQYVYTYYVTFVSFSPDSNKIVSASKDNIIRVWDTITGEELELFTGHTGFVISVNYSPDGKKIILGSSDNIIRVGNVETLLPLDNPKFIKKKIKFLEQQLQAELDGINLKDKSIPFKKPIWSKYNPHHWLEEANDDNVTAMYELGIVYDRENETNNALEWYEKASDLGHSGAKERLEMLRKWMEKNEKLAK